ncbi:TRM11 family SAM-dependent methyltransferase [Paenibacillus whitsoniae]|uniref:RNA methyltransferase n=1 Tax=Paenibacillus whitsoniae TaxID=2496558 RepID=A0A430JBU5_9BACL|nr:RsmD family RNA methyltransferase [Paenibacillus whitsoniae]RTE08479.1 RNA methyltransferase [Paenibacillus whitsoniae]
MKYVYVFACHEDEQALCDMELRALLGADSVIGARYAVSARKVEPSRSPFVKLRLAVELEAGSLAELAALVSAHPVTGATFKVVFAPTGEPVLYDRQREIERELGRHLRGQAEMRRPAQWFAVTALGGRWLFGDCAHGEAVWLQHQQKPQNYSTALPTRIARAVVNVAVPDAAGTLVDPCCGIGTVLIEALSMGIDSVGFDLNPLAVRGARVNLRHFGLPEVVGVSDMRALAPHGGSASAASSSAPAATPYDALVLDMPYNLCSKLPEAEALEMLEAARRLARRAVILTTEEIDPLLEKAGLRIVDRCLAHKGRFSRQVIVCERA